MNKILIGFKNCGKTTYGKLLSEKQGCLFVDTDELIAEHFNDSVRAVYERIGEQAFRDFESALIENIDVEKKAVIALGGGAKILDKKIGTIIYLKTNKEILKNRFVRDNPSALVQNVGSFDAMYDARVKYYEEISDHVVDLHNKSDDAIIAELMAVR